MTSLSLGENAPQIDEIEQQLIAGKRRRQLRETITGYLFILPAALATFLFGLWPVVAGLYESIKAGSPITNRYVGLANYERQLGSLTYAIVFAVSVIFIYLAYQTWSRAYRLSREKGGVLWYYLLPGFLAAAALICLAFILVAGIEGITWVPVMLFVVALAGFYTADHLQRQRYEWDLMDTAMGWVFFVAIGVLWLGGPALNDAVGLGTPGWIVLLALLAGVLYLAVQRLGRIRTGSYIGSILTMCLLMLLGLLLGRYGISQMVNSTDEARQVAADIFNEDVLRATVTVLDENASLANLAFEQGQVMVQVKVGSQTLEAPLAPSVYSALPVDKIARLEAAFVNNQKVQVVMPDGTIAEGQLTGIAQGESLEVGLVAENAQVAREVGIYSALDVGEEVVRAGGHTEPLIKQIYAALGIFIGIGTVFFMTAVRRQLDDERDVHLYRWLHYGRVLIAVAVFFMFLYQIGSIKLNQQAAAGMGALSQDQFNRAYVYVIGEMPPATMRPEVLQAELLYWPQVFSIAVGAFLIGVAYVVWQSAQHRETVAGFGATLVLAVALMVGGWLLISEIPRALALGGRETEEAFDALSRTAMYSLGTVPVQLALGLFLAYLLFSEISWGKSLYRVIYFMPYIAPSVATSTVFLVIFRLEPTALANRVARVLGFDALTWLKEPQGIFRIFYEQVLGGNPLNIPESLAGPSLALTTVILYNIWVFSGYNAVVFLAGLGAIPGELYEAAEVDGAGRWSRFRNITLPLLSPTTFFLSMLSIIGTFKAFSHIYVLRGQATGKEIDTLSVHIFNTLYSANDPGYAAALAFSLFGVILILTLVQNRLARSQVFYG